MKIKKVHLSVIVPVFNEERRVRNLKIVDKTLLNSNYSSEIIIVDDGSTDRTQSIIGGLKLKIKPKIYSYTKNRGKGYAVRQGMLKANGKYRLFLDVDLSTPPNIIGDFLKEASNGYEIVIGSRKKTGARLLKHQSLIRELLGKGFTSLSRLFLHINISDFTCGFKMFSERAAKKIFKLQKIDRWGFDSEVLFLANKYKFKIKEIPVEWSNSQLSKVKFPQDIIKSLWELILIRFNSLMGHYN